MKQRIIFDLDNHLYGIETISNDSKYNTIKWQELSIDQAFYFKYSDMLIKKYFKKYL